MHTRIRLNAHDIANLSTSMYFLAMLTLDGYLLAPRRAQFSLSYDTYDNWCLLLPKSGSFTYEIGDDRGVARFGDIVVCPPGGTLRRRMTSPTSFFHARFRTDLEPPAGCSRVQDLARLRTDLSLLDSHSELVVAHVVADLILMMQRQALPGDKVVQRATTFILDHFTSPDFSLGELAEALGISPSQLTRRFQAVHGVTPVAYLRSVRLQKARELLTESDETLQAIAEHSGYRSAFYLSRVFTNHTGQSPSAYRRSSRV